MTQAPPPESPEISQAPQATTDRPVTNDVDIEALNPLDEHNRKLRDHVHPPQWTNPTPPGGRGRYNPVVIGAGTAGLVTAAGAAGLGARVALVERSLMGGDCLNVGCVTPNVKTLFEKILAWRR